MERSGLSANNWKFRGHKADTQVEKRCLGNAAILPTVEFTCGLLPREPRQLIGLYVSKQEGLTRPCWSCVCAEPPTISRH